ncbi:MAG: VWA domain-containing protein [Planctomycetes bacterium]|nr:VWA domain-containing protein [Planctomycetota bacterium]
MTQIAASLAAPGNGPARHKGSASIQLTGRALLTIWILSIATHALLFFLMLVVPWLAAIAPNDEPLPLTRAELIGDIEPTAFTETVAPDLADDPTATEQTQLRFTPKQFDQPADAVALRKPKLSIIGIGAESGDFSKYGLNVGVGGGPSFFGIGGTARGARKIAYVVDRSGSMLATFEFVREELRRSISALRRSQKFHVVFFSDKIEENPPKRMVSAIQEQKQQFFDFLNGIEVGGGTHPARAMQRAFATKPDLIYFLTDGEFNRNLLPKLRKWNKDGRVRIFTIAYFSEEGALLLERIANEHNGEFKRVTENDLP